MFDPLSNAKKGAEQSVKTEDPDQIEEPADLDLHCLLRPDYCVYWCYILCLPTVYH